MKNNQKGFSAVEGLLVLIIVGLVGFIGWYVYHTKNTTSPSKNTPATSSQPNQPKAYSSQDAVSFTQKTYNTYLAAVIAGNKDNTASSSGANTQTLPQMGLAAVKDNLTSDLYVKIAADESSPGKDSFGCTLYLPDKYTASLKSSNKTSAVVGVSIISGGNASGTINVTVDLSSLKISSVTCPN